VRTDKKFEWKKYVARCSRCDDISTRVIQLSMLGQSFIEIDDV